MILEKKYFVVSSKVHWCMFIDRDRLASRMRSWVDCWFSKKGDFWENGVKNSKIWILKFEFKIE